MRKLFHSMNAVEKIGEVNLLPSKTVPDMAIPLEVLIDRYIRGIDLSELRTPYWQEDSLYVPDPRSLDLVDIEEMRINNNELKGQLDKDIAVERVSKLKAKLEEKLKNDNKDEKEDI